MFIILHTPLELVFFFILIVCGILENKMNFYQGFMNRVEFLDSFVKTF